MVSLSAETTKVPLIDRLVLRYWLGRIDWDLVTVAIVSTA